MAQISLNQVKKVDSELKSIFFIWYNHKFCQPDTYFDEKLKLTS